MRLAGADLFKVELVDPWLMKIYTLGYTGPGDQAFTMPAASALLRITAADKGAGQARPIGELAGVFFGDESTAKAADPALFASAPIHYDVDFQIAQIQQSPAGNALLEASLPPRFLRAPFIYMTPEMAAKLAPLNADQLAVLKAKLAEIPVN